MLKRVLMVFAMALLLPFGSVAVQGQGDANDGRRISYLVCDWGLLTVEESTEQPPIFIDIASPGDYSAVEGSTFTLSGTGAGLFEGNVIVEASLVGGDVVFEGTTVLDAAEPGAVGDWSIEVDLGELTEATPVFVRVYSTSPADGSTTAYDILRLNAKSTSGLRYVDITNPTFGAGVSASPMRIEGMAGGAFESTIAVTVRDFVTGDVLAETVTTVEAAEAGGSGPFAAEVSFEAEPGTAVEVLAYQPQVTESDAEVSDIAFAIVNPLVRTYDRFLTVQRDDPIAGAQSVCDAAEAEFDNENINLLTINDVQIISTRSMMPLVHVSIEAAGSSNCPAPLRTRITRDESALAIETYYDATEPVACTADLAPIPLRVSLGTLPNPDYTITVNGQSVD